MSYLEYLSNIKNFYSYYKHEPNKFDFFMDTKFLVKKNSYIKVKKFSDKWVSIPINKDIILFGGILPFELKGKIYKINKEIEWKHNNFTVNINGKYMDSFHIDFIDCCDHWGKLKKNEDFLITKELIHNNLNEKKYYKKEGFYFYFYINEVIEFNKFIDILLFFN